MFWRVSANAVETVVDLSEPSTFEEAVSVISEGVELDDNFDCLESVKAIYGLKQASLVWNKTLDEFVCSIGFQVSGFDPCLCIKMVESQCVLVLVYVDEVLVTGSSPEMIARTKDDLKTRFEMTDSGKCTFVLGIELVDGADGRVTMCQRRYVDDILKRFGMENCKAVANPVDMSSRLRVRQPLKPELRFVKLLVL